MFNVYEATVIGFRTCPREQTNGGADLRFGTAPIRRIVFNKIVKMDSKIGFEMSLIVVEAYVDGVRFS